MNSPGKKCAFTLLEVLVAMGMIAVLAGSLYATLHIAFRARRSALETIEPVRRADLVIDLLRTDVQSAVVPRGILAGSFLGEDEIDAFGRDSDTLVLHCTTVDPARVQQGSDIKMIELSCEPSGEGAGQILVRRIRSNLLATRIEDPPQEVLSRDVQSFNLRYFDGEDWQDSWDSGTHDNVLPLAVEVTLQFQPEQDTREDNDGYWTSQMFLIPCSSLRPGGLQGETR